MMLSKLQLRGPNGCRIFGLAMTKRSHRAPASLPRLFPQLQLQSIMDTSTPSRLPSERCGFWHTSANTRHLPLRPITKRDMLSKPPAIGAEITAKTWLCMQVRTQSFSFSLQPWRAWAAAFLSKGLRETFFLFCILEHMR